MVNTGKRRLYRDGAKQNNWMLGGTFSFLFYFPESMLVTIFTSWCKERMLESTVLTKNATVSHLG